MFEKLFAKRRLMALSEESYYSHKIRMVYGDNQVHEGFGGFVFNQLGESYVKELMQGDCVVLDEKVIPMTDVRSMEVLGSEKIIVHAGEFFNTAALRWAMQKETLEALDEEYRWFQMECAGAVGGQPIL